MHVFINVYRSTGTSVLTHFYTSADGGKLQWSNALGGGRRGFTAKLSSELDHNHASSMRTFLDTGDTSPSCASTLQLSRCDGGEGVSEMTRSCVGAMSQKRSIRTTSPLFGQGAFGLTCRRCLQPKQSRGDQQPFGQRERLGSSQVTHLCRSPPLYRSVNRYAGAA